MADLMADFWGVLLFAFFVCLVFYAVYDTFVCHHYVKFFSPEEYTRASSTEREKYKPAACYSCRDSLGKYYFNPYRPTLEFTCQRLACQAFDWD